MTNIERERLLAILKGKPVGVACPGRPGLMGIEHRGADCGLCHGTGRIHTQPEGPVEEAAARLRRLFNGEVAASKVLMAERDEALARAERAEADAVELGKRHLRTAGERDRLAAALRQVAEAGCICRRALGQDHGPYCVVGAALGEEKP